LLSQSEPKLFLKLKEDHILKANKNRVLRAIEKNAQRETSRFAFTI